MHVCMHGCVCLCSYMHVCAGVCACVRVFVDVCVQGTHVHVYAYVSMYISENSIGASRIWALFFAVFRGCGP